MTSCHAFPGSLQGKSSIRNQLPVDRQGFAGIGATAGVTQKFQSFSRAGVAKRTERLQTASSRPAMGAKLHIQLKNAAPFEVRIGNTATIGRTRENTVALDFSPLVSRQHALIRRHGDSQYQIIDLGSRNGNRVNDHRVVMPVTLAPGDRIRIAENTPASSRPGGRVGRRTGPDRGCDEPRRAVGVPRAWSR